MFSFRDPATGARCLGPSSTPPAGCAEFARDSETWRVPVLASSAAGTFVAKQCSFLTDHIVVEDGGAAEADLTDDVGNRYDCSVILGRFFRPTAALPPSSVPGFHTCPLYRYAFDTAGGGSHLFTTNQQPPSNGACELPARANVLTIGACYAGTPSACQ